MTCDSRVWSVSRRLTSCLRDTKRSRWTRTSTGRVVQRRLTAGWSGVRRRISSTRRVNAGGTSPSADASIPPFRYATQRYSCRQSDYLCSSHCPHGSDGLHCFRRSFFLFLDNSRTATLSSVTFCRNMYLNNRTNPVEFQGCRSKFNVSGPYFRVLYNCEIGQRSLLAR